MGRTTFLAYLALVLAPVANAAPPLPRLLEPVANEWSGPTRDFTLGQQGSALLTPDFTHFEIEVSNDAGVLSTYWCSNDVGDSDVDCSIPTLSAGPHSWRARTLDGGERSAWTASEPFRWDNQLPLSPVTLNIDWLDGGALGFSWPAGSDALSGIKEYDWALSYLPYDAGLSNDLGNTNTTTTARTTWLGPGEWVLAVHSTDNVDNSSANIFSVPVLVVADPSVPAPSPPFWVQGDGGRFILQDDNALFSWTTPLVGGRFIVAQRELLVDGGVRRMSIWLSTAARTASMDQDNQGLFEVVVAHAWDSGVSAWSAPTTILVDGTSPARPTPVATTDAGWVFLRWQEVNDTGTWRSGIADYTVGRCCTADASVSLGRFPAVSPDASVTVLDAPGPGTWSYSVVAWDRSGNPSLPGVAQATVDASVPDASVAMLPQLAAPLVLPAPLSTGPLTVSWEDAGVGLLFDLQRAPEGMPTGTVVATDTAALAFVDAAPDGRWQYAVRATQGGQLGAWSPFSVAVLVDTTPPQVTVSALRQTASEVQVSWTAVDPGSGLASVALERETSGTVVPLGAAQPSPVLDTPPDGTHRYRVVAIDVAGLTATSPWTTEVVTPGPVVSITAPGPQEATCSLPFSVTLVASGDSPVTWSLVDAPPGVALDAVSGALSWTPPQEDTGVHLVRVRAEAPASVDEEDVPVDVTCAAQQLGVGCGCTSALEWPLALAALAWLARRRCRAPQSR